ncbi:DUF4352 domain-containing protein [Flexivirga caeni]|uniref:DUF4352 domain-containing protein n=1 Tax=Flexivirga caeni TaxID=2294115 RepID=A0A3M9M537_9MICO|nr:DUF4352 domain-containing protein [Flexivirga caeni]RNI20285.1 DUF4352 domain-containing protein [Flexivirga caeni]
MSTTLRRITFSVVPVVLAVGAVAGCSNGAPGVAAPPASSTHPSATSTQSSVPTVASTPSTSSGVPTVATAPATSGGGDSRTMCTDPNGFGTPAAVAPSTKKAAWGKPLAFTQAYGGTARVTPASPVAKKPPANDLLGPPAGQQYLLIKVTATYQSGNTVILGSTDFTLRDAKGNVCDSDSLSGAVPTQEQFNIASLSGTSKTYTGTLVFDVPIGQDYTKYTLLYLNGMTTGAHAQIAWTK